VDNTGTAGITAGKRNKVMGTLRLAGKKSRSHRHVYSGKSPAGVTGVGNVGKGIFHIIPNVAYRAGLPLPGDILGFFPVIA
jgi:hypothetical protein